DDAILLRDLLAARLFARSVCAQQQRLVRDIRKARLPEILRRARFLFELAIRDVEDAHTFRVGVAQELDRTGQRGGLRRTRPSGPILLTIFLARFRQSGLKRTVVQNRLVNINHDGALLLVLVMRLEVAIQHHARERARLIIERPRLARRLRPEDRADLIFVVGGRRWTRLLCDGAGRESYERGQNESKRAEPIGAPPASVCSSHVLDHLDRSFLTNELTSVCGRMITSGAGPRRTSARTTVEEHTGICLSWMQSGRSAWPPPSNAHAQRDAATWPNTWPCARRTIWRAASAAIGCLPPSTHSPPKPIAGAQASASYKRTRIVFTSVCQRWSGGNSFCAQACVSLSSKQVGRARRKMASCAAAD